MGIVATLENARLISPTSITNPLAPAKAGVFIYEENPMTQLRYIGNGKHITGIPARDLDASDLVSVAVYLDMTVNDASALLVARGLYALDTPKLKTKKTDSDPVIDSEVQE